MFGWFSKVLASLKYAFYLDGASAPGPKRPTPTDTCAVENKSGPEVEYLCGHHYAERFTLNLFGESHAFASPQCMMCAECLLSYLHPTFIRCAACGFAIKPYDGVAVYVDNGGFKEEWKTPVVSDRERGAIACLRPDCCPSEAFFSGYWMGDRLLKTYKVV